MRIAVKTRAKDSKSMDANIFDYLELEPQTPEKGASEILLDGHGKTAQRELYQKVTAVGAYLKNQGFYNRPIAVAAAHRVETVILYLGILASGNYYIPIAPDMPRERFYKICKLAGITLVLGSGDALPEHITNGRDVSYQAYEKIHSSDVCGETAEELKSVRRSLPDDAPMYIIFTSGSTGEPKGIVKTHEGMISFLNAYIQEFGFRQEDCLANQTPFYFDASAKDIYLALKIKCRLHILEEKWFVRPLELAEYLRDEHITVIQWVPSALSMLSQFRVFQHVQLQELRMVLFVGEVFPVKQLRIWMEGVPDAEYINLYGASEMAGVCAFYRVEKLEEGQLEIPVGRPMKNSEIYLLDENGLITDPGRTGELYVRSRAVAAGYLHDAERTKEVFVSRPLPQLPEGRYYRSGDLAKYRADGELVFVSRRDYQVKHMGHRIELGEIESAAQTMEEIHNCCCLFEKKKLILFYEGSCEKAQASRYLKKKLAAYMLPNKLVKLEQWPLNANGKVDRVQLKKCL